MIGTDQKTITELAEVFRVMLGGDYSAEANWLGFNNKSDYLKFQDKTCRKIMAINCKILIRIAGGEYQVFNGLGVQPTSVSSITDANYVRALDRITGLNDPNRSGDIILIMRDDMSYPQADKIEDHRFTAGVACKSWHGSLNPSDFMFL